MNLKRRRQLLYDYTKYELVGQIAELEAQLAELRKENAALNREYNRTWDVLRATAPLTDIELEYIGFESVPVASEESE